MGEVSLNQLDAMSAYDQYVLQGNSTQTSLSIPWPFSRRLVPLDVIDEGITGCMNEDLKQAVNDAMMLDRQRVWEGSGRWTWEKAWEIFRDNLVPVKSL